MIGLSKERRSRILTLSLPIILGMMSQVVLNLVDTKMVSTLGPDAVAAVGMGGFANFLCIAFVTGMSAGVQAIASRRKGEGRHEETAIALNGGLLLAIAIALPLSSVLFFLVPSFFPLLTQDANVLVLGIPYLQARLVAMVAVGCNFAFRGYWNGVDKSRLYLRSLLVMHVSNVAISYVLIFGAFGAPEYGAVGAAIGTSASTCIGTIYYFIQGHKHAKQAGFLHGIPDRATIFSMLRLSAPAGAQSLFFAAGLVAMSTITARVGTHAVAGMTVLINVTMVAFLPGLGLGLAAATLVGQALGRKQVDDAEQWAWDVIKVGIAIMLVLGIPMAIFPELILGEFFDKNDEAFSLSIWPLRLAGLTIWSEAILMTLLNSMLGAGATRTVLVVDVGMQWGVFLPVAYLVGPTLGLGLLGIWCARICYRFAQAVILAVIWRKRVWATAKV